MEQSFNSIGTARPDWNFQLAHEFSKAFTSNTSNPIDTSGAELIPDRSHPRSLGDFDRIFQFLGCDTAPREVTSRPAQDSADSASSTPSSYSTAASSDPAETFEEFISHATKDKGVRWKDGFSAGKKNEKVSIHAKPLKFPSTANNYGLIPSSVDLPKLRIEQGLPHTTISDTGRIIIKPLLNLTQDEQERRLTKKILRRLSDQSLLTEQIDLPPRTHATPNQSPMGIHVFVDFSNISIGFLNRLKSIRNIHEKAHVKRAPMSCRFLSLILERGRPVARRILVGSTVHQTPITSGSQSQAPPKLFAEASACGYELNILERVCKPQSTIPIRKKKNGSGNGYLTATSGQESGSESATFNESRRLVMAEQGVDEILQMKLLESLVDTAKPTTMVLASGDAAEAEYSGGFLKNVERALLKGWEVEVVAWHDGLSSDYKNRDFLRRWKGRIRIIELDDYCEELLAIYSDASSGIPA